MSAVLDRSHCAKIKVSARLCSFPEALGRLFSCPFRLLVETLFSYAVHGSARWHYESFSLSSFVFLSLCLSFLPNRNRCFIFFHIHLLKSCMFKLGKTLRLSCPKPHFIVGNLRTLGEEPCLKWSCWLLGKLGLSLKPPHFYALPGSGLYSGSLACQKSNKTLSLNEVFVKCESGFFSLSQLFFFFFGQKKILCLRSSWFYLL